MNTRTNIRRTHRVLVIITAAVVVALGIAAAAVTFGARSSHQVTAPLSPASVGAHRGATLSVASVSTQLGCRLRPMDYSHDQFAKVEPGPVLAEGPCGEWYVAVFATAAVAAKAVATEYRRSACEMLPNLVWVQAGNVVVTADPYVQYVETAAARLHGTIAGCASESRR